MQGPTFDREVGTIPPSRVPNNNNTAGRSTLNTIALRSNNRKKQQHAETAAHWEQTEGSRRPIVPILQIWRKLWQIFWFGGIGAYWCTNNVTM